MMLETPKKLAMVHPEEGLFDADDAKNEVPGHTVAFIDGKSIIVGQPRGIRSASAKTDWLDVRETDVYTPSDPRMMLMMTMTGPPCLGPSSCMAFHYTLSRQTGRVPQVPDLHLIGSIIMNPC